MDAIMANQAGLWLALGFLLMVIELVAFGLGSGVLLFGSLGALLTGALLWFGLIPNLFIVAVACFVVCSSLATALLWRPLKRMQSGAEMGKDRSSDLIGHSFQLGGDIDRNVSAQQKYSGISWRVEPSLDLANPVIKAGTRVTVTAVSVGAFFVEPADK